MIVSASRRTDIPAFYSEWFFNRLDAGYLYAVNPMNRKQVSKIILSPETVDCFVFWTKNPRPMMEKLAVLDQKGFPYYFQYTLTPYDQDIEPCFPDKNQLVKTFRELSGKIGQDKVIWRYDPILLSDQYTREYHYEWFEKLCHSLCDYTNLCVISFLDLYDKTKRNTKELHLQEISQKDMLAIGEVFAKIAAKYHLRLETCSEEIDLSQYGIEKGKCIDDRLISQIIGKPINVKKDDTQREVCGCVKSVDIGQYNTCQHYCAYCYANYSYSKVKENCQKHDIHSEILTGKLVGDEKITTREMKSIVSSGEYEQMELPLS